MDRVGQRFSGTESKDFWKLVILLWSNVNVWYYTEIRMQIANKREKVMFDMRPSTLFLLAVFQI